MSFLSGMAAVESCADRPLLSRIDGKQPVRCGAMRAMTRTSAIGVGCGLSALEAFGDDSCIHRIYRKSGRGLLAHSFPARFGEAEYFIGQVPILRRVPHEAAMGHGLKHM